MLKVSIALEPLAVRQLDTSWMGTSIDRDKRVIFGEVLELYIAPEAVTLPLSAELSLYPQANADEPPTLRLHCGEHMPSTLPSCPREHLEAEHGFMIDRPYARGAFARPPGQPLELQFHCKPQRRPLRSRFRSIQYATRAESAGQILHELVLVPAVHLLSSRVPLHASGVHLPEGGALLLGGTGGVGKTSLELELCLERKCGFLADDISVVAQDGQVWPNLNFPKIYAYNLTNNTALKQRVLPTAMSLDQLQWQWLSHRKGTHRVRRRVSPFKLFPSVTLKPQPLKRYVLLAPYAGNALRLSPIDAELATALSLEVLCTEFATMHSHLRFHSFNRRARGLAPIFSLADILKNWHQLLMNVLSNVDCRLLEIPVGLQHKDFKRRAADAVLSA